jgi:peptidoglycan/LPS O-acetylase OafA/YrhL
MVWMIWLGVAKRSGWFLQDHLPGLPFVVFLQNFWMASRGTLGGPTAGGTWSLAIEEQFYLTLPLLIRFVDIRRKRWVVLAGIIIAPVLRIMCFSTSPPRNFAAVTLMPCRADALLFGVLGALLWRDERWRAKLESNPRFMQFLLAVLLAGAGFLTIHAGAWNGAMVQTLGLTWMAALYLCFLLCGISQPGNWLSACLRWRWLTGLGAIAYGVYLIHFYARAFLYQMIWSTDSNKIATVGQFVATLLAIPLTLAVCQLSFTFFEKPLIRIGHRWKYE